MSTPAKNAAVLIKRALGAYNASDFDQAIEHSRAALIMLDTTNDDESQALLDQAFERLCISYQRTGDFSAARDVLEEWESRTQRVEGETQIMIHHSRVEDYLGNYETSASLADQAIQKAKEAGLTLELGIAKRVRADMYWKRGHTEKALALGQEAIRLLEHTGALDALAGAHVTIAAAYHASGQFYKAIEPLKQTARIVEQLGRRYELSIVYSNLGETYAELYAMDKALEAHQNALELVGIERASPDLIRNLGVDLLATGQINEGLAYLDAALERAQQINDPDMIAQVHYSMAEYYLKTSDLDAAEKHCDELHELAERLDSLRHKMRAMMISSAIAQQRGDHAKAQSLLIECSMTAQQSADRNTIWRTHAALYDLLHETMPPMASIHQRIAAEMMTTILTGIEDKELYETFINAPAVKSVLGT